MTRPVWQEPLVWQARVSSPTLSCISGSVVVRALGAAMAMLTAAACSSAPAEDVATQAGSRSKATESVPDTEENVDRAARSELGADPEIATDGAAATEAQDLVIETEELEVATTLPYGVERAVIGGQAYACSTQSFGAHPCVKWSSGPAPRSFFSPDLWCDGSTCTEYDPDEYFEITYDFDNYLCESGGVLRSGTDCVRYAGGPAPSFLHADLYCSGSSLGRECSDLWYPDELDDYELVEIGGRLHLCDDALLGGSFDDMDCAPYNGGDPDRVSFTLGLKCSRDLGSLRCERDFYPSELDGLEVVTISGGTYVCEDTYQGSECFRWWSGSPRDATYGRPDYYCNRDGCAQGGYPDDGYGY